MPVRATALLALLMTACGGSSGSDGQPPVEPEKLADVADTDDGAVTLHLYISNQSSDPELVQIDVFIDDVHIVTGDFDVEGQHNWYEFSIAVPPGSRALHVEGQPGDVVLDETVEVPGERWGVIDYWFYPGEHDTPHFTWSLHDEPVAFE